ncbi:MAG: hypothetical protein JKY55_20430 [Aliivibrio sp.]|uniref:hypothetical protein n=1 Tax=Aliivibrio sp. TaxID=1872443 RepID=UPI001A5CEE6A|nr:hypothetical protein [Aliivibrio sp.]
MSKKIALYKCHSLRKFDKNLECCDEYYGTKAKGLSLIPQKWTFPYFVIPCNYYTKWVSAGKTNVEQVLKDVFNEIWELLIEVSGEHLQSVIFRSSATNEGLNDRGKYDSFSIPPHFTKDDIFVTVEKIFSSYSKGHAEKVSVDAIAIIVQKFQPLEIQGHMSNEVRFMPTRERWRVIQEKNNQMHVYNINSTRIVPPDDSANLFCNKTSHLEKSLRRVARWAIDKFKTRMLFEWGFCLNQVVLLQLDFEIDDGSGVDPTKLETDYKDQYLKLYPEKLIFFKQYSVCDDVSWHKLRLIRDFDVNAEKPLHKIYYVSGEVLAQVIKSSKEKQLLIKELEDITVNKGVVRVDICGENKKEFNLPRTDTISAKGAFDFMVETFNTLVNDGADQEKICFIVHRFIPAISAAWSLYRKGDEIVYIDSLWGLPDGLQFDAHNTFEVNLISGNIAKKIRYKPNFLKENSVGKWQYEKVEMSSVRKQVLSTKDILYIAAQTRKISINIDDDAQVMWFCDIPKYANLGTNLPWYRASNTSENSLVAVPPEYREIIIKNENDLENIEKNILKKVTLRIEPEVDFIRNTVFVSKIAEIAVKHDLPVVINGSILGHAYFLLKGKGVTIYASDPQNSIARVRQKRTFGKLVRDKIPEKIARFGERVVRTKLPPDKLKAALSAKLIEELQEYLGAKEDSDIKEELADIFDVLKGLISLEEIEFKEIENISLEKSRKRGGFNKGIVLVETSDRRDGTKLTLPEIEETSARNFFYPRVKKNSVRFPHASIIEGQNLTYFPELASKFKIKVELKYDSEGLFVSFSEIETEQKDKNQMFLPFEE